MWRVVIGCVSDMLTVWCYCVRALCDVLRVWCYCVRALCDVLRVWCYCVRASPWGWQECRPKHVGENFANKIHHKYWRAFCWLFIYLYIIYHIDARQLKHTKSSRPVYFRHSGTLLLHQHLLFHLPMHLGRRKFFSCSFSLKGKAFCIHALKAYRGSRSMAPFILNLGTRWRWVVSFTRRPQNPQKITPRHVE